MRNSEKVGKVGKVEKVGKVGKVENYWFFSTLSQYCGDRPWLPWSCLAYN